MRPDNIGDVILATPVLRALKATLPDVHLTLFASAAGGKMAPMLPWIDDLIIDRPLWQAIDDRAFDPEAECALIGRLRAGFFDAAVILTSFSQSPFPPAFVCRAADVALRLGESIESDNGLLTHTPVVSTPHDTHQALRNVALLSAIGIACKDSNPRLTVPPEAARRWRDDFGLPGKGYIALVPFASCAARTYHLDRSFAAGRSLGRAKSLPVVALGTARDRPQVASLLDANRDYIIDGFGRTDLTAFAAALCDAALIVTGNTSALHFAEAFGVPVVAVYSGSDPVSHWRPRGTAHRLLRREVTCSPCYRFDCPNDLVCMDLRAEDATAAGLALLEAA